MFTRDGVHRLGTIPEPELLEALETIKLHQNAWLVAYCGDAEVGATVEACAQGISACRTVVRQQSGWSILELRLWEAP
jgi:hypothetical protein